ncbi:MAG: 2-oxoacid:ferredoxin oxidoreductase subunit beta [Candidatus Marinimicrobia bacterium]|jgi:2-oxoglutarate ferredoxin oxidoreductase subunit beta|nr:2-oxoacid:ferredoxin oxidoreductase subunit beta [Candidatus Neomarinimicrobiota bacterium]
MTIENTLTRQDFVSDQDVRWCPGCGDYAILSQVQKLFPALGIPKENFLIISGIGCSSRFPYYMDTYGFHSIHGRAPALASGAKIANPDLSVWVVTGDGDAMSIGGNHLIHVLRRNIDMNILMFNNRIYGLTKGQYSPTSEVGKITKSTPMGSLDYPFNPPQLALGASGTFIARTIDREQKHMGPILEEAHKHKGTSFVEIYQNCNIFNDGAFSDLTEKETKAETQLVLEQGEPMIFGAEKNKGLILDGSNFKVVKLGSHYTADDILNHDKEDKNLAMLLSEITYNPELPVPIGILYQETKTTYEDMMTNQIEEAKQKNESANLEKLFSGTNSWIVD